MRLLLKSPRHLFLVLLACYFVDWVIKIKETLKHVCLLLPASVCEMGLACSLHGAAVAIGHWPWRRWRARRRM